MQELLIADKDVETRKLMANLLIEAGYDVMVTDSAVKAIQNILTKDPQVLLLGAELEEISSAELIPLLKKCKRNLKIIFITDNAPLPLIRKIRKEGIFYHALKPLKEEEINEIKEAVKCAINQRAGTPPKRRTRINA